MLRLLVLATLTAQAELPIPTYPECGEPDRNDLCPDNFKDWDHLSYIPENARESIRPGELEMGSGLWVDRAFRTTTGRWDVLLAAADSGYEWDNHHLNNKIRLNNGELPFPQDETGTDAGTYDLNGDGIDNIQDWVDDPRVDITAGSDVADAMLDPSDLIYTFSDGVDDDDNGYPDDIAGWDFFGRDNDAGHDYAEDFGTHGTEVMEDFGSEAGTGKVGICPNCAVLPIRVGDTFVTDGGRAGEGMAYAIGQGAVAVTQSIGALSNPDFTTAVADYAFSSGTSILAAAGDENAYHHNFPAVLDNIVYTHSIRYNTPGSGDDVYSYLNTWNCNNYGARLVVVAPSGACATGAVASLTGVVGLMHSAARDAGIDDLHAGEVYQLMVQTADDIWLSEEEVAYSKAYPSQEGWDAFYGYGRVNTAHAVEAIAAGEIPPWVSIDDPSWFEVVDPRNGPTLEVIGRISAERSSGFSYTVEVGLGDDPRDWETVDTGEGSGFYEGPLTTLTLSDFPMPQVPGPKYNEGILERMDRVNAPAVTVRIKVQDADGRPAEMRKTFFVQKDPDLLPGFPLQMGASGESSPVLADLDDDGIFEVVVALADGRVRVFDGTGHDIEGWPQRTERLEEAHHDAPAFTSGALPPVHDGIIATAAVGDLEGDGQKEVVVATLSGAIYAWHADGTPVSGFPVWTIGREPEEFDNDHTYDQGYAGAPSLADVDGDGDLEIVAAAADSRLYVYQHDGSDLAPYPKDICHSTLCGEKGTRIINSVTIEDIDGDGDLDFLFGSNEAPNDGRYSVAYGLDAQTGEDLPGWPLLASGLVNESVLLPLIGEGHPAGLAVADLDGDGAMEIANPVMFGTTDLVDHEAEVAFEVAYYAQDFHEDHNAELVPAFVQFVSQPAFGDLNMDGTPDFVLGGASTLYLVSLALTQHEDFQQAIGAWNGATGEFFPGWPRQLEDLQFLMSPAIADVSGDGMPEVIYGSAGYMLYAWDAKGLDAPGWPKFTGQWILGSPAVGDIDGDGYVEVVVTTREGWLYAWTTAGHADQAVQWAGIHHDPRNTGSYHTPLARQAGPVLPQASAAGCCKSKGSGGSALLVLPLALLGWRRRRG